jgi:hypothetical protein
MSLTYGYELKENDDILIPVRKTGDIMAQVVMPGAALVNHLPFRTEQSLSLSVKRVSDHNFSQCDTHHRGSRCSSMSRWPGYAGS